MKEIVTGFAEEVCSIPGGETIHKCIQCGVCSGSCPNADLMDYSPRKLIAMVRSGMREEVLSSNSMWYCLTCYLCTVRCPRGIKPTELMHALECLAVRHDLATRRTTTPIVYQSFVDILTRNGRVHEVDFIFRYYLNLYRLFLRMKPLAALKMVALAFMTPVALKLFGRGRLAFKAKRIKRRRELNAILNRARS